MEFSCESCLSFRLIGQRLVPQEIWVPGGVCYVIFVDISKQNCVVGVGWKREIFCHFWIRLTFFVISCTVASRRLLLSNFLDTHLASLSCGERWISHKIIFPGSRLRFFLIPFTQSVKWYINFLRHPKYVLRTEKQNTQSIFSSDRLQIVR